MYTNPTALLILVFLFLLLQSAVVWISDEILLVISFVLFYLLGYQQMKYSITDFLSERNFSFQNSFFPSLKELAIQDLEAQKEFQYFKNINLAYLVSNTIDQEKEFFELAKTFIQESRKSIHEYKCVRVVHFENSYKSEMSDHLVDSILEGMFDFSKASTSSRKDFHLHQAEGMFDFFKAHTSFPKDLHQHQAEGMFDFSKASTSFLKDFHPHQVKTLPVSAI